MPTSSSSSGGCVIGVTGVKLEEDTGTRVTCLVLGDEHHEFYLRQIAREWETVLDELK